MKNFLIVFLALMVGVVGGYFGWRYYVNWASTTGHSQKSVTAESYQEPFMWGVNVNPSALRNYSLEMWNKEIKYVSELGVQWIRLPFTNEPANKFEIHDEMIEVANAKNIKVYLGLGSSKPILTIDDTYSDGYNVAKEIASRYKGKIKYYQLMSEQGSTALKGPEYSGEKESDYDIDNYQKVKEWMRGASTAIRKVDSDAYIVITDQWLHYAYIDMLLKDKIDFDIIGWDWFGDMGFLGDKKLDDGSLFIDKLRSYNKPIILAEVNYRPGKKGMDEAKQAAYIEQMADWAYNSGYIKGFFVHELVDLRPVGDKPGDFYGLIEYKKAPDGGYTFGDKRQAFNTYQEIIAKYKK